MKNKCPSDEEIERTKEIIKRYNIKIVEELTKLYLKSDATWLTCVFEKYIKVSIYEFDINTLYCVSLPGYTWQAGSKHTDKRLQTLQDKDMILLLKSFVRGGISSVMGERYVKSDDSKKILYIDAINLYCQSMCQRLPNDEIKFGRNVNLEDILNTPDDSDISNFVEVDLSYPNNIKEKTKNFPLCLKDKRCKKNDFSDFMKKTKPDLYTQTKS